MRYYKPVNWNIPSADQILELISIPSNNQATVSPIDLATQKVILNLLKVNLDECSNHNIMLVHFPPHTHINIHSDKPKYTKEPGKLDQAIIIPLKSCEQLHWSWYEVLDDSKIYHYGESANWKMVPMIPFTAAKEIETTMCDKTFISDIGSFHALRNTGNNTAIAISIRLMPWGWEDFTTCNSLPPIEDFTLA